MKKTTAILLALLLALSLSACCMGHDFAEATCTEPATCAKCGETEGEALRPVRRRRRTTLFAFSAKREYNNQKNIKFP